MRLIDGDKLKRKVQKVATEAWKMKLTARVETVLNQCIDYIDNAPTIEPEQRWIPSGEKPPEKGSYLVWMPFAPPKHRMTVAEYCGGYWNIKTPISAWMLLPEPYKAERREE